jgi:6-phosphogluconolactonase (cycloisomerase 2 family)
MASSLVTAFACTFGCGAGTTPPTAVATPSNTYLYVGGNNTPDSNPEGNVTGSMFQFRVESGGTLTAINATDTGHDLLPYFAAAVSPGSQYLFVPNGGISEFGINDDGMLGPVTVPAATGDAMVFTPNGQFALISDDWYNTLVSYSLSDSGELTLIDQAATGSNPLSVAVDGTGRFAYVANGNDGTISEYTISAAGEIAVIGTITSGGYNPLPLLASPGGFLYCGNTNSGSASQFSINASTGALTLVKTYEIWPVSSYGQGLGARWISFNPAGTYAFASNGEEIAQFSVDKTTGILTTNGTATPSFSNWGGVDPSGRFLFTANGDGSVSQFIISSAGTLIPNGSASVGENMVTETLTFAQR